MIFCNGFPKAGTHWLVQAVFDFGMEVTNLHFAQFPKNAKLEVYRAGTKQKIPFDQKYLSYSNRYFCHSHLMDDCIPLNNNHTYLHIIRNPRDIIIATLRSKDPDAIITEDDIIDLIKRPKKGKDNFLNLMKVFTGHKADFIWYYENRQNEKKLTEFYNYLSEVTDPTLGLQPFLNKIMTPRTYLNDEYKITYRDTPRSDWKVFWNERIDAVYKHHGGHILEKELGYDNL